MKLSAVVQMGLLSFLIGCVFKAPYHKKDGAWFWKDQRIRIDENAVIKPLNDQFARAGNMAFFRAVQIDGADGTTFEALADHYARDKSSAWYCDDYRDGKEYFMIKHTRITPVEGVDIATFKYLDFDYARDNATIYFAGKKISVADPASFELLTAYHARDHQHGYYLTEAIPGSDGKTFAGIDEHYSKDAAHVFYTDRVMAGDMTTWSMATTSLSAVNVASFAVIGDGFATDSTRLYYKGRLLEGDAPPLQTFAFNYAKSATHVYWNGNVVIGADAATFALSPTPNDTVNAVDSKGNFYNGKRVKP